MKKILAMMTLIALFASCQRESDDLIEPTLKRVKITPTIVGLQKNTRATELSFEQGDKVGLTIIKGDQSKHSDNALMTYTNGAFAGDIAWYEGTTTSRMIAYYPYSSTGMPTSFTVSTDQTTGYGVSDLMGAAKSDVAPTNDAISMTFKHLMSKIIVNVKQTDADITSVVLQNSIPTATVDLENQTIAVDKTATATDIIAQTVTANSNYRAIVVPQTTALTIVVTTQSKTHTQKLSSATIQSGGQYSINVEIAKGQLNVTMSGDIENWTDEGELGEEENPDPMGYELRILTFEDADYKGSGSAPYWTSLIDNPQYGGPLLYGDYMDADYSWYDENNTFIAHEFPENYNARVYWGGGHAISNYTELDLSKGSHETQLAVYYKNGTTGYGGNNGSENFCMHFGYIDDSPFNQTENLPSFYFKDGKARVIDHMYVMVTTYLANCIINGNSLTDPCGPDDWIKVVATGYDENGEKLVGKDVELELTTGMLGVVMDDWQKWDLSALGKVSRVEFNMSGSNDNGYGFSQPAYFAYDDVAVRFEK